MTLALAALLNADGPALQGRITDADGKPLPDARVILSAGIATRWQIAEATTDADGRYRFDTIRSSMVKDRQADRWDQYVGVRVEHPTHVEADGRSWRDLRIPGLPGHVETLDLTFVPAGHLDGTVTDAKSGAPLGKLDLRIMTPPGARGHGVTFSAYATTDDDGRFRTISLFPGEYDVEANSNTMDYPLLGRATVEGGRTTRVAFAVTLPRVITGRVVDAAGTPIDGVDVTLLAPKDEGVTLTSERAFIGFRSRSWTFTRPEWQDHFELAFLPGLEQSRFVLCAHKTLGWAKVPVEQLDRNEPIRLTPWPDAPGR